MQLDSFGQRLREERERLGLSQEAFGALGSVKKLAQLKYEKGERAPDISYLAAIEKHGVDINYLLSGVRGDEAERFAFALQNILLILGEKIGMAPRIMEGLMHDAWREEENRTREEKVDNGYIETRINDALATLRHPDVDAKTLTAVLETIEDILEEKAQVIPPRKKATIAAMHYQVARDTGKVDRRMIEYAVFLAVD